MEECCEEWEPQIKMINGYIVLQSLRSGDPHGYRGIPFRFCPWCGTNREEFRKAKADAPVA